MYLICKSASSLFLFCLASTEMQEKRYPSWKGESKTFLSDDMILYVENPMGIQNKKTKKQPPPPKNKNPRKTTELCKFA